LKECKEGRWDCEDGFIAIILGWKGRELENADRHASLKRKATRRDRLENLASKGRFSCFGLDKDSGATLWHTNALILKPYGQIHMVKSDPVHQGVRKKACAQAGGRFNAINRGHRVILSDPTF
jgi:hypothetical protein